MEVLGDSEFGYIFNILDSNQGIDYKASIWRLSSYRSSMYTSLDTGGPQHPMGCLREDDDNEDWYNKINICVTNEIYGGYYFYF